MSFPLKLSHLKSDRLFVHWRNKLVANIAKTRLVRKIVSAFSSARVKTTEFTRAIALVLVDNFLLDIENT